jgi:hypothetical protein
VRTSSAALQVLVEEQLDNDFVIITGTDLGNLTLAPDTVVISDINPACTDMFCLNGGTCNNVGAPPNIERNCTCPEGYSGSMCEIAPTTIASVVTTVQTTASLTMADTQTIQTVEVTDQPEATTVVRSTSAPSGSGLTTLQIVGIALGLAAFVLLIILMCLCMLVVLRRRQAETRRRQAYLHRPSDRMKIFYNPPLGATRISEYRGYLQPDEYLGLDDDSVSDNSSFIASLGHRSEEESRMRHLANVITQSPYLNERMMARISSMMAQDSQPRPQAEFVRPYLATGREAAEVHRDPEDQSYRPQPLPQRQTSFQIPRAQFFWDSNSESFT